MKMLFEIYAVFAQIRACRKSKIIVPHVTPKLLPFAELFQEKFR